MLKELFTVLKNKAQETNNLLSQVTQKKFRVHALKKTEIVFLGPGKEKLRLTVIPGLQKDTYSLSTGYASEKDRDGFLQRDVPYESLLRLMTNPMIWSWTYKSFNRRFSLLNGLIRLAYHNRAAWPFLKPLIKKAL